LTKAVVVHAGRRDNYQVALALQEAVLLEKLVTDFYFAGENRFLHFLFSSLKKQELLGLRYINGLPSSKVSVAKNAMVLSGLIRIFKNVKYYPVQGRMLGISARKIALRSNNAIVSYSTYAEEAFKNQQVNHRILFQHHPHPASVRKIFEDEIQLNPAASNSLKYEYELSLNDKELEAFMEEPFLANNWMAASTFTAKTLIEHGIPADKIYIIPYGVNLKEFKPKVRYDRNKKLKVLFVGSFNQRKGLSYLLEAIRRVGTKNIELILVGRGIIDKQLLASYADVLQDIRINISHTKLLGSFYEADVFVLPSIAEGFAQVLLEAMACGLPVITTENTAGPDIITNGKEGFIVPVRNINALVEALTFFISNPEMLENMGRAAALQANHFTWEKFRSGIVSAYKKIVQ
jgi:glycosyltransferase involved in cell wall biosynthesis